jgi:arsenite methyltransferase
VAGALPERVFGHKLERVGFVDIASHDSRWLTIDDCARFPLFPPPLIERMRRLLPPERLAAVARSVVFTARRP